MPICLTISLFLSHCYRDLKRHMPEVKCMQQPMQPAAAMNINMTPKNKAPATISRTAKNLLNNRNQVEGEREEAKVPKMTKLPGSRDKKTSTTTAAKAHITGKPKQS